MRHLLLAVLPLALAAAGCNNDSKPQGGPPPPGASQRGAPPPPADSAKGASCAGGGGEVKDAVSAGYFPRTVGGYCVNPDGTTLAFGQKTSKPISGICDIYDGGCKMYEDGKVLRAVRVDYVDGSGGAGMVTVDLMEFPSPDHAVAIFTKVVTNDEDPTRDDMPRKVAVGGAEGALGTGSLRFVKGTHFVDLSYVNTNESGDVKKLRASSDKVLPVIAEALFAKLPDNGKAPPALALLPAEQKIPLGVTYTLDKALGADGTGATAFGFYKDGDKRWRILAISKADPDQAKDVLKSFGKKKGATEEKGIGEGGLRFTHAEKDGDPKAEWIVARKGKVVVGIGDEAFAQKPGAPPAENDKVSLSRDDKQKKLRALLDAAAK